MATGRVALLAAGGFAKWTIQPKTSTSTSTSVLDVARVFTEQSLAKTATDHLPDLGQLAINIPQSKLPAAVRGITYLTGFLFLGSVGLIIVRSRQRWNPARTVAVCYSALIYFAPYTPGSGSEPRYWLPVLPIFLMELIGAANASTAPAKPGVRLAVRSYAIYFLAVGFASLAYSDAMSVSEKMFLQSSAIAQFQSEYRLWLLHEAPPAGVTVDPDVVQLLRIYGGERMGGER